MAREVLIRLYLLAFKLQFVLFNLMPIKRKVTFVMSFEQNSLYVYEELQRQKTAYDVVFLCDSSCYGVMKRKDLQAKILPLQSFNPFSWARSIYHICTSKYILVDNYFGFLAAVSFKKGVECIQLWHAAGAVKTFGMKDHSIHLRSKNAIRRFLRVYRQFHKVVAGSDHMAEIFMQAFHIKKENILHTGIPRTDLFFDENKQRKIINELHQMTPVIKEKKVLLYAPTFRDESLDHFKIKLDLEYMYKHLHRDYVLMVKLHPAIQNGLELKEKYSDFIIDYSAYRDINHLLLITDFLITDYSSIPYEFALLKRPMIFYPYDLENYQNKRGLWEQYDKMVPGPIVWNTPELVNLILKNDFDLTIVDDFSARWNKYSNGNSSEKLVSYLYRKEKNDTFERGKN